MKSGLILRLLFAKNLKEFAILLLATSKINCSVENFKSFSYLHVIRMY